MKSKLFINKNWQDWCKEKSIEKSIDFSDIKNAISAEVNYANLNYDESSIRNRVKKIKSNIERIAFSEKWIFIKVNFLEWVLE